MLFLLFEGAVPTRYSLLVQNDIAVLMPPNISILFILVQVKEHDGVDIFLHIGEADVRMIAETALEHIEFLPILYDASRIFSCTDLTVVLPHVYHSIAFCFHISQLGLQPLL